MDSLDKWMNEVDSIDDRILSLFKKRMEIIRKSVEYKKRHGIRKDNKIRDIDIKKKAENRTDPDITVYAEELITCLINVSNRYESRIIKEK